MKRVVLIIAVFIFVLVLIATFLLRTDLVSEKVKAYGVIELAKATRHKVVIEKAILNFVPPFIEFRGIELFDGEGISIIKIKRARGHLGLGDPLQRELSVRVKILDPSITIERDERGELSISPLIESIREYLKEEKKAPVKIDFKGLSVEKGGIDLLDKKESLSIHGKGLSFKLRKGLLREGSRINFGAEELKLKIKTLPDLILKAEAKLAVHGSRFTVHALKITNLGSSIGIEGDLDLSEKPQIDLKATITIIARTFKEFLGIKGEPKGELHISGKIKGNLPGIEGQELRADIPRQKIFPEVDLDIKAELPVSLIKEITKREDDIEGIITVKGSLKGKYPELVSKGEISLSEGKVSGVRIKKIGSGFSSQFTVHGSQFTFPEIKGEILDGTVEGRFTGLFRGLNTQDSPASLRSTGSYGEAGWAGLRNIESEGWIRYTKGKETRDKRQEISSITPSIVEKAEVIFHSRGGYLSIERGNIYTRYTSAEFSGSISLKTFEGQLPFKAHSDDFSEWVEPYYKGTKGSVDITGELRGLIVGPTIEGKAEIRSAKVKGVAVQMAYGDIMYKDREISASGFQIEQEGSSYLIDGRIRFRSEGPYYEGKAKIRNGNPRKITSIFYKDLPIDTSVNGEITFGGGNREYEGEADLNLGRGVAYGQNFDKARIRANLKRVQETAGEINFPSIQIEKGDDILYADGRIGFDGSFHGKVSSKRVTLSNINLLKIPIKGNTSLKIIGKGTFNKPEIIADLRLERVSYRILKSTLDLGGGDISASLKDTGLQVSAGLGGLKLAGKMSIMDDHPWNAGIFLKDLRLDDLFAQDGEKKAQNSSKVSLITTGSIKAEGKGTDPDKLSLIAKLNSISLNIFDYRINNDEDAEISLKNRELRVHSMRFKGPQGSSIEIGGDLRLNDSYNLYLYGKADLGILRPFIPQIESLNGEGEFMVALSDRWQDPRVQGMISLKNGIVKIRDLPQRIGKLTGNLTFEKDRIILDSLQGELGGGSINLSGFAVLKELSFRNFYIQARADGVRYRYFEGLTTTFDGKLVYEGNTKSQTLNGEIIFRKALYTKRIDWKSWLLEIRKIEEKPKAEVSTLLNTNLNIHFSGKVDVDNNIGKGPVSIDLLLKGTPVRPLLFGRIEANEGQIFFRNNSFRVISASADFFDPNRIYPVFNVVAVTELKGYRIHLSLSGPIDRFSLSLSSDPPLSETDLIALLTVGQPTRDLKGLEAGVGASEAASFLTGKLQDVLEERFRKIAGLDRFQVDPYVTRSSSAGGPRLTVGKSLIDGRLYMTYSANIGTSEEQVIRLEYILGRNVSLVGVRDEQGQVGGDLKFRFEFR